MSKFIWDILAQDGNGPVSRVHLALCDHVKHLNQCASLGAAILRPLCVVELCHNKPINLGRILQRKQKNMKAKPLLCTHYNTIVVTSRCRNFKHADFDFHD